MTLRRLLIACCALLSAQSIAAQTGASADPVSGTWTGLIGPGATPQIPVTLELKFDGKAAVTGTLAGLPTPGDVKTGTFDPQTGALKLELGEVGNAAVRLVLEGTVVLGSATGRASADETGTFKITRSGETGGAPQSGPNDASTAARAGFAEVSGWVTKAADLVPADKYTYRPVPTVRTFGELIAHIADGHNWYCARASGRNAEWSDAVEKGKTDKATVVQKLKQSIDACNAVYGGSGQIAMLFANAAHSNLHYGNIITYMRMLGMVPPSS
jgi:DinB family protein